MFGIKRRHLPQANAVLLLLAVLAGLTAGAWGASALAGNDTPDGEPSEYADHSGDLPQLSIAEAIDLATDGVDSEIFVDVHVADPPEDSEATGAWFFATIDSSRVASLPGGMHRATWEADLIQGSVADSTAGAAKDTSHALVGASLWSRAPDGTLEQLQTGAGSVVSGQIFEAQQSGMNDQALEEKAHEILDQFGLTPITVEVLHPLGPALVVSASVESLEQPIPFDAIREALVGDPALVEGLYLEIANTDGSPIARGSVAYRVGSGRFWVAPGMEENVLASHGGLPTDR